jgi:AcrR family transcriptional regulator
VRRFGEAKTNVVDIARALGTSHATIYRYFRSKADVFSAIAASTMRDEEELARTFVDAPGPASERLTGLVLDRTIALIIGWSSAIRIRTLRSVAFILAPTA